MVQSVQYHRSNFELRAFTDQPAYHDHTAISRTNHVFSRIFIPSFDAGRYDEHTYRGEILCDAYRWTNIYTGLHHRNRPGGLHIDDLLGKVNPGLRYSTYSGVELYLQFAFGIIDESPGEFTYSVKDLPPLADNWPPGACIKVESRIATTFEES